jgi:hypothetical protein
LAQVEMVVQSWSGRDNPAFVSALALRENQNPPFLTDKDPASGFSRVTSCKQGEIHALRARQKSLRCEFRGVEVGLQCRGADGNLIPCDCPICLDVVDENDPGTPDAGRPFLARILRCGHVFHEECLRDALRFRRRCPKCRGCLTDDEQEGPRVPRLRARNSGNALRSLRTNSSDEPSTSYVPPPTSSTLQQQVVRSYVVAKQWVLLLPLYECKMYAVPTTMSMYVGRPHSVSW